MRKTLFIVASLSLAALGGFGAARAVRRSPGVQPYTVVYRMEVRAQDGVTLRGTVTRSQYASGAWHETTFDASGQPEAETFGDPARGVYALKGGNLYRLSDFAPPAHVSMADYVKSDQFVREDNLLGVPVAVMQERRGGPDESIPPEFWIAPSLGGETLKTVVSRPGAALVKEAVNIERGEPRQPAPPIPDLPETPREQ